MQYAAFLRGINVGGHNAVPMDDLKKAFQFLGFQNVKTLLASGNVIFNTSGEGPAGLAEKISKRLKKTFGFSIGVLVRTIDEIQELVESAPFKNVSVTPKTRLYVTFISGKPKGALKIPYESPGNEIRIFQASQTAVLSAITLTPGKGTIDLMGMLEKEFGGNITTRNWNTVVKMIEKSSDIF